MKKLAFIGAGGQGGAVLPMVDQSDYNFVGYYDDRDITEYDGFPILGKVSDVKPDLESGKIDHIFIAIGSNSIRRKIYDELGEQHQEKLINVVSNTATIMSSASIIGKGTFVGHNAYVGPKSVVHANSIVNTGAIVEHDCIVGEHSTVAPRATLNGFVILGEEAYIGSGAVVVPTKQICAKATVGAGAAVIRDITEPGVYVGVPTERVK